TGRFPLRSLHRVSRILRSTLVIRNWSTIVVHSSRISLQSCKEQKRIPFQLLASLSKSSSDDALSVRATRKDVSAGKHSTRFQAAVESFPCLAFEAMAQL